MRLLYVCVLLPDMTCCWAEPGRLGLGACLVLAHLAHPHTRTHTHTHTHTRTEATPKLLKPHR